MIAEKKTMGVRCAQGALILINTFFALIGLLLFIVGCIVKFGSDSIEEYIQDKLSATLAFIRSAGSNADVFSFDLGVYLSTFAFVLIGLGGFFLLITCIGCCGGCGKIRFFLVLYTMILVLLILFEIAFVIALVGFTDKVKNVIKEPMLTSIKEDYNGINSSDVISVGWNFLMVVFECCGAGGAKDFSDADQWDNKYVQPGKPINGSLTVTSAPITIALQTPIACCKWEGKFPKVRLPDDNDFTCASSPTNSNSNMNEGCVDAVVEYIKEHYVYILTGAAVIVLSQVAMLLMAICLLRAIKRQREFDQELHRMFNVE